jgi:hypothetical protein
VQGTGTEEWGGGGDYWGGQNMTLAFVGHPTGARKASEAKNDDDLIESAYRFLLSDLMPFGKNSPQNITRPWPTGMVCLSPRWSKPTN